MSFPAFYGVVSDVDGSAVRASSGCASGWVRLWSFCRPALCLSVRGLKNDRHSRSWIGEGSENATSVFVRGEPLIATDADLGSETKVERIAAATAAERIARLYREHGERAFALLEGSFSLVIRDGAAQQVLLVVDKFGCDDIYVRRNEESLEFASHAMLLARSDARWSATAAAFFLAQEGFVPAPFTLFDGVESIGRAKLLRIKVRTRRVVATRETYWNLPRATPKMSTVEAVDHFHRLLADSTASRCATPTGILLSGGIDSSLLANLIAKHRRCETIALTGAIAGHWESESEVHRAAALSSALSIPHESVYLDAKDEDLPDDWVKCTTSWSGGTRLTLPLYYRFAKRMRDLFGASWSALSGQMADTLADSNYTLPSVGYTIRRMFFSSWFFRRLRFARQIGSYGSGRAGSFLVRRANSVAGPRFSGMLSSLLDGLSSQARFYDGRIFGCGEMPGRSRTSFPVLSDEGFEEIAGWHSRNYVAPVVERLTPETFYAGMIELSMDMCMLHLDTRLPLHVMRLCGGDMQLPFLDSRIVNFFAHLPYAMRAFFRQPKHVIHAQFGAHGYARPECANRRGLRQRLSSAPPHSQTAEGLLLRGSLGAYFQELLSAGRLFDRAPELGRLIDHSHVENQVHAFRSDLPGVNYKFIARIAALEQWCQMREEPALTPMVAVA